MLPNFSEQEYYCLIRISFTVVFSVLTSNISFINWQSTRFIYDDTYLLLLTQKLLSWEKKETTETPVSVPHLGHALSADFCETLISLELAWTSVKHLQSQNVIFISFFYLFGPKHWVQAFVLIHPPPFSAVEIFNCLSEDTSQKLQL